MRNQADSLFEPDSNDIADALSKVANDLKASAISITEAVAVLDELLRQLEAMAHPS